jgi:hypothetical protein
MQQNNEDNHQPKTRLVVRFSNHGKIASNQITHRKPRMQSVKTENPSIIDLFGNSIKVTNIEEAIRQASGGQHIDNVNFTPFEIVNGRTRDIKGREHESVPAGEYWTDMLNKLETLKAKSV